MLRECLNQEGGATRSTKNVCNLMADSRSDWSLVRVRACRRGEEDHRRFRLFLPMKHVNPDGAFGNNGKSRHSSAAAVVQGRCRRTYCAAASGGVGVSLRAFSVATTASAPCSGYADLEVGSRLLFLPNPCICSQRMSPSNPSRLHCA